MQEVHYYFVESSWCSYYLFLVALLDSINNVDLCFLLDMFHSCIDLCFF
jgi:hypothetical protein